MNYRIWSIEHNAWWRERALGYSPELDDAGYYTAADARDIVQQARGWEVGIPVEGSLNPIIIVYEP